MPLPGTLLNILSALFCLTAVFAVELRGQTDFSLCIENQPDEGNASVFDVYALNAGSQPLNLATADFVFECDVRRFCGAPSIEVTLAPALRLFGYNDDVSDLSSLAENAFGFSLNAPLIQDGETDISDRIINVGRDEKVHLFRVVVGTICEPSIPAGFNFGFFRGFQTIVHSYPEKEPFADREFLVDVNLQQCEGGTVVPSPASNIGVWPNPVRDLMTVSIPEHPFTQVLLDIYDVTGRVVETFKRSTNGAGEVADLELPAGLATGAYVVHVRDGNGKQIGSVGFMLAK